MSEQQQPAPETIILHSGGSIPGIPGDHAPGTYTVDYVARTLTLVDPISGKPVQTEPDPPPTQETQASKKKQPVADDNSTQA